MTSKYNSDSLDILKVGATNLLDGTYDGKDWLTNEDNYGTFTGEEALFKITATHTDGAFTIRHPFIAFEQGKEYTLSFQYKTEGTPKSNISKVEIYGLNAECLEDIITQDLLNSAGWQEVVRTFTPRDIWENKEMSVRFYNPGTNSDGFTLFLKNIKLEKGNVATDYSLSINDLQQMNRRWEDYLPLTGGTINGNLIIDPAGNTKKGIETKEGDYHISIPNDENKSVYHGLKFINGQDNSCIGSIGVYGQKRTGESFSPSYIKVGFGDSTDHKGLQVNKEGHVGIGRLPSEENHLHVAGNTRIDDNLSVDGNISAKTVNGVPLTNSGDGSTYLSNKGTYQEIDLSGYLPLTGGTLTGDTRVAFGKKLLFSNESTYSISVDGTKGLQLDRGNGLYGITLNTVYNNNNGKDVNINTGNAQLLYNNKEVAIKDDIKEIRESVGLPDGIAPLDENGFVPSSHLPSYVDDVLEFESLDKFPNPGETGKIYVTLDTNLTYRWSGTHYVEISKSIALGETSSTAYPGDKGKQLNEQVKKIENTLSQDYYNIPKVDSLVNEVKEGTVEVANKLANKRTFWGQEFDGTKNVSGNLSSVGSIYAINPNQYIGSSGTPFHRGYFGNLIVNGHNDAISIIHLSAPNVDKATYRHWDYRFSDNNEGVYSTLGGLYLYGHKESTITNPEYIKLGFGDYAKVNGIFLFPTGQVSIGVNTSNEYQLRVASYNGRSISAGGAIYSSGNISSGANIRAANTLSGDTLSITNTEAVGHINFSRGSYNYFTAPEGGIFAFVPNGRAAGQSNNATILIGNRDVWPGINSTYNLGSDSHRWQMLYTNNITNTNLITTTDLSILGTVTGPLYTEGHILTNGGIYVGKKSVSDGKDGVVLGTGWAQIYGSLPRILFFAEGSTESDAQLRYIPKSGLMAVSSGLRVGSTSTNTSTHKFLVSGTSHLEGDTLITGNLITTGQVTGKFISERIPNDSDLNDYKIPGMYYSTSGSGTLNLPNNFLVASWGFSLLIERTAIGETKNLSVKQTITPHHENGCRIWFRTYHNQTEWTEWQEIYTTYNLPNITGKYLPLTGGVLSGDLSGINLSLSGVFRTGGKTSAADGLPGIVIGAEGALYLQSGGSTQAARIDFYRPNEKTYNARIQNPQSNVVAFPNGTRVVIGSTTDPNTTNSAVFRVDGTSYLGLTYSTGIRRAGQTTTIGTEATPFATVWATTFNGAAIISKGDGTKFLSDNGQYIKLSGDVSEWGNISGNPGDNTNLTTYLNNNYLKLTGGKVSGLTYFENHVYVGPNKTKSTDGNRGITFATQGFIGIATDSEGSQTNPQLRFYRLGATEYTSVIGEVASGLLAIPRKLIVGTSSTSYQDYTLTSIGKTYLGGSVNIADKLKIDDRGSVTLAAVQDALNFTYAGNNTFKALANGGHFGFRVNGSNSSTCIIGEGTVRKGSDLTVSLGAVNIPWDGLFTTHVNNVAITNTGNGTKFLADDGTYKTIPGISGSAMAATETLSGEETTRQVTLSAGNTQLTVKVNPDGKVIIETDGDIDINPNSGRLLYKGKEVVTTN